MSAVTPSERDSDSDELSQRDFTAMHRMVLDSMTEGVSVTTEDGTIIYTNPAEDRIFGYLPGELIGQHVTVQNAYPPEENQRLVQEVITELQNRGVWTGEWLNRKKDGTSFYTQARITAVEIGGRKHWVCVQEDITARKQEEIARQAAERQILLLVEASSSLLAAPHASKVMKTG